MIDSHIHFYDVSNGINEWIKSTKLPHIVKPQAQPFDKFVHIEAHDDDKNPLDEIDWVLSISERQKIAIIANIDFRVEMTDFAAYLLQFENYPSVVGFRQIQAYHPDSAYSPYSSEIPKDLFEKLCLLADKGYIYEVQMYPEQLLENYQIINSAGVTAVVEHMALPIVNNTESFSCWKKFITELENGDKWYLKLSGFDLVNTNRENIEYVINHILEHIPSNRLCFGSNYPVSHQTDYNYWYRQLKALTPVTIHDDIFNNTAQSLYFR